MKFLYLYHGWNSGTNQALLDAWRAGSPQVEVEDYDPYALALAGARSKVRALPHALRRGGIRTIVPGQGRFIDAIRRSGWCMERIIEQVEQLQESDAFDFSLAIGSVIHARNPKQPHFVYTDLTVRANAYYPEGAERLRLWRECIPYEEESFRNASLVFTMSDHVTRSLVEQYGVPREKIVRVNGGINSPPVCSPDASRYESKNILFVGVQWELKGGPQLVEAFVKVRKCHPQATLTIVGCSPNISLPGVQVIGCVPQAQVPSYLSQASFFCMVSRREAFGIAYIEAMHAGLPIIASDLGATPDFVINGSTGYRVHPDDIDGLAERMNELLSDSAKCRRMGEQATSLAQAHYTWEQTQKNMWRCIREVIGSTERETGCAGRAMAGGATTLDRHDHPGTTGE